MKARSSPRPRAGAGAHPSPARIAPDRSGSRLAEVIRHASDGIVLTDPTGRIVYVNPAFEAMNGYTSAELRNRRPEEFIVSDDQDALGDMIRNTVRERGEWTGELVCRRKSGETYPIQSRVFAVRDAGGEIIEIAAIQQDITERVRVQAALRRSMERYRALADNSVLGIAVMDTQYRISTVNAAFARLFRKPAEAFAGKYCFKEFEKRREVCTHCPGTRAMRSGATAEVETQGVRDDGSRFLVRNRAVPIFGTEGAVSGFIEIVEDIDAPTRAKEELRESEEKYRALFGEARDGICVADEATGVIVDCNAALAALVGRERSELIGRPQLILHPAEQAAGEVSESFARHRSSKAGTVIETQIVTKGGGRRDVAITSCALRLHGRRVLQATFRDITERVCAEKALRLSEAQLSNALKIAHAGHWEYDVATDTFTFNDNFYRIFRTTAEEVGGYRISSAEYARKFCHPDDTAIVAKEIQEAIGTGDPNFSRRIEHRIKYADGEIGHIAVRFFIVKDAQGRTVGTYGVNQDVTERKRAEAERLDMERRLQHSQKLESLGVMAGGIAHDFNNLLMAILGNLDLALLDLPASSAARTSVEEAVSATRRAAHLTHQMLAYSGKGTFAVRSMHLNDLLQENIRMLKAAIPKNVMLDLQLDRNLPPIRADGGQVQQVIMNLITNAAEATGEKGGVVYLSTGSLECDEAYLARSRFTEKPAPGRFVFMEVIDSGCGMNEETVRRMFDPFFTTKLLGRGLGMSAVLGIVRGHKGAVFVKSEPGRGTAIRILFPVSEEAGQRNAEPGGEKFAGGAGTPAAAGTVLVVDDEEIVRAPCAAMVSHLGFRTLTAANGEEAAAVFREHADEIFCVILDLSMPGMDGVETFEALRRTKPGVPVILSSGYNEREATRRFTGRGLAGFIQKPYEIKALRERLEKLARRG